MHLATLYNPQLLAPFQGISASQYINRIIPILIYIGFIVCVLAFVILLFIGGIQYITSGGDKAKLEGGRNRVTNAITGLIILLLLWFILKLFNLLFGIDIGGMGPWTPGPPGPTSPPIATPTIEPPGILCGSGGIGLCQELNYCLNNGGSCIVGSCGPMVNPCCCLYPAGGVTPTPTPGGSVSVSCSSIGGPGTCSCVCSDPDYPSPQSPDPCLSAISCATQTCECYPPYSTCVSNLLSPANNENFISPATVNYSWTACSGAVYYELYRMELFTFSSGSGAVNAGYTHLSTNQYVENIDLQSADSARVTWHVQPCYGADPGVALGCVNPGVMSPTYTFTVTR